MFLEEFRNTLESKLGEIIEHVIGEDALRRKFDESGGHPAEYAGTLVGSVACQMGLIDEQVKHALLIAQSAARTLRAAERIEAEEHSSIKRLHDPAFHHIGMKNVPQPLTEAQVTWALAETYRFIAYAEIGPDGDFCTRPAIGKRYVDTLKVEASKMFDNAANILKDTPHEPLAQNLRSLAIHTASSISSPAPTTMELIDAIKDKFESARAHVATVLNDEYAAVYDKHIAVLEEFSNIISGCDSDSDAWTPGRKISKSGYSPL